MMTITADVQADLQIVLQIAALHQEEEHPVASVEETTTSTATRMIMNMAMRMIMSTQITRILVEVVSPEVEEALPAEA